MRRHATNSWAGHRTWLAAVLALGGALVACSSADPLRDERSAADSTVDLELLRVHRADTGAGMDAIVAGVVEVDLAAGCVWLSEPEGSRYPVVWPLDTTARTDPLEITLADGRVVRPGDAVEGAGGYVDAVSATRGSLPFPEECVQAGEAAVFNPRSPITVTPGVGLDLADTLVGRFAPPEPIGLELVAIGGSNVVVADFVNGAVHRYGPGDYAALGNAIDGASGGGGFIHLWSSGVISSYPGRIDTEPLVYEPDPLRRIPGIASTVVVLPAPGGERTWLVQPGFQDEATLVELVDLVEVQVRRIGSHEITGAWNPAGATTAGLVMVTDVPESRTVLVGPGGDIVAEVAGRALSVGRRGAAVLRPDGSLFVTDADLANEISVDKPAGGGWVSVGGPAIPSDSPPLVTGASSFLLALADDPARGPFSSGELVVVDANGAAAAIYELSAGNHIASWSRDEAWVVVIEDSTVTIVPGGGGSPLELGTLIPEEHWVLTAG